jgi:DNA-directed RNA polymerase specialized sigma24 family protein
VGWGAGFQPPLVPDSSSSPLFPHTRWSLIQRARVGSETEVRVALELLCRAYWYPLYCVARQKQLAEADAQDAVQGFFESLLRRETFTTADETVGKLRQLLLRAFDNFCGQQWEKSQRQKRGGGAEHIEFTEMTDAERRYLKSCESSANPEALYNRAWASSVMERSLQALRDDYEGCGWLERYELLMPALMQQDDEPSLTQLAVSSGTTAGALRVTLHRMRGHYRSMIKRELALTLDTDDPKLLREELAELLKAFA